MTSPTESLRHMATVRHAALNIVKAIPDKASLKVRRKTLGWDDDYLFAALTQPTNALQATSPGAAACGGRREVVLSGRRRGGRVVEGARLESV